MTYYSISAKEVEKKFKVSRSHGLSSQEAAARLNQYGKNKLGEKKPTPVWKIFLNQFNDPLVWVLIFATLVSLIVEDYINTIIILAILLINAAIGTVQEYKADRSIQSLRKLRQHKSKVIRDSKEIIIDSLDLVPGDIILLEAGDKIPADCRILKAVELSANEASLTGESQSISKTASTQKSNLTLGDQKNMLFSGTILSKGKATALVVATGVTTELGKIAKEIESIEEGLTPLQKKLKDIGKWITISVSIIAVLVFIIGLLRGFDLSFIFLTAVTLAVAAVPEGLPAVVTVTLALGLGKMIKRKALIRKLKSVETLGSVTVICSDKTGTLTHNEMTVTKIFANWKDYTVTGSGYIPSGKFLQGKKSISPKSFASLLKIATTCNDATTEHGDPTERSLKVLAEKAKVEANNRVSEIPFSSDRKFMSVTDKEGIRYIKGAVEVVLAKCSHIEVNGKKIKLTAANKKKILEKNTHYSQQALRVLAMAYGKKQLTFAGLVGIMDPPRSEVKEAIRLCSKAGIRPIMITGDHEITARAVAKQVGIQGNSISGHDLDNLSEEDFQKLVKTTNIFARVTSLHKARILKTLQDLGEVVAMTGDGVNDAPAIKQSNVGVAMNIKGTELTKDVSDLILLDDNFATIVAAIKEGRVIYNNIKKFVKFLLAANFGEVVIIFFPVLFGSNLPLLPAQLLWINLVTDSFPALALGLDPADPKIMDKKPRNPNESFFAGIRGFMIFATVLAAVAVLGVYFWSLQSGSLDYARTMAFTTLIMFELFLVFSVRSKETPIFKLKHNYYLYAAVALSFVLHLILLYSPLGKYFQLVPLTGADWLMLLPLSVSGFVLYELYKIIRIIIARKNVGK